MAECEQTVTSLLISIARASTVLQDAAFRLRRDPAWPNVTYSLHPSEFNRHLTDADARLALQGNLHAHLSDGREVEWQLEVSRSGNSGWLIERSIYVWLPNVVAPSRQDLPDATCSDSAALASHLPQLVEDLLTLMPALSA